ncbi:MAG: dihydrodipicolinate synthase family protein [Spirochaetes bacterium]|nr:dihydrodipicolinate synthase family protein [Spirochaetota bacterium]
MNINGLIAAPFTPMHDDGSIAFDVIPSYAEKLIADGIAGVFVNGTTGEGQSLSSGERLKTAETWMRFGSDSFRIIINTGHTALPECIAFAKHAEAIGAHAVGLMPPYFFRPSGIEELVSFCAAVAAACPKTPVYYYHIPSLTGVTFPMLDFLRTADGRIPNLAGVKFTHENIMDYAQCLSFQNGKYDILFGRDEILLSSLAVGAKGAIGSTYNFAAPLYRRIMSAFAAGDIESARAAQTKAVNMIAVMIRFGGLRAGKAIMRLAGGIDCGPVRFPLRHVSDDESALLGKEIVTFIDTAREVK